MASVEEIFAQINELKPMQVAELIKKMEEEWGVSAASPAPAPAPLLGPSLSPPAAASGPASVAGLGPGDCNGPVAQALSEPAIASMIKMRVIQALL